MNLFEYDYNMRFADRTDPKLYELAKARGFTDQYGPQSKWIELFSNLFFGGGRLNFNESVSEEDRKKVMSYLREYMQGFNSSHGEKTAICAMLLSEVVVL